MAAIEHVIEGRGRAMLKSSKFQLQYEVEAANAYSNIKAPYKEAAYMPQ
jgi:hypothetical protein